MAVDIEELGLSVDGAAATAGLKGFEQAARKAGQSAEWLEMRAKSNERVLRRQATAAEAAKRANAQMAESQRAAARAAAAYENAIIQQQMHLHRLAAAEREAYVEQERLTAAQMRGKTTMATMARTIGGMAIAYVGWRALSLGGDMLRMADEAKLLEGRLRLVTGSSRELADVQEKLFAVAQKTGTSYEGTVELYARVARNAKELKRSQAELMRFTELTQMSIITSGSSASEAAGGVIQLSQALASGTLRGDEFRSVMENMPGLARAIAEGMGVQLGALRALAFEGKLTANVIIDALLKMEGNIQQDFEKMPITAARGWTVLRNEIMLTSKALDEAADATGKIGRFLTGISLTMGELRKGTGTGGLAALPGGLGGIFDLIGNRGRGKSEPVVPIFGEASAVDEYMRGVQEGAAAAGDAAQAAADKARELAKAEKEAYDARFKAWQESKKQNEEKAQWEYDAAVRTRAAISDAEKLAVAYRAAGNALHESAGAITSGLRGGTLGGDMFQTFTAGGKRTNYVPGTGVMSLPSNIGSGSMMKPEIVSAFMPAVEDIAENYRRSMQDATGSFISDFLTSGKSALGGLFSGLKGMGADLIGNTIAKEITAGLGDLTSGAALGLGGFVGVFSGAIESFLASGAKFRAELRAAAEATANLKRELQGWASDAALWAMSPDERQQHDLQQQANAFAREAFNIYRKTPIGKGAQSATFDALAKSGFHTTGDFETDLAALEKLVPKLKGDQLYKPLLDYYDALKLVEKGLIANTDAAKAAATAEERLAAIENQQARIDSLSGTIDGLEQFRRSLGQSDLSTMNPMQKLAAARAEFDRLAGLARGGDQQAAMDLQDAGRVYLEMSKQVNATGGRYVADYTRVQDELSAIIAVFGAQRTEAQQQLDAMRGTHTAVLDTNRILTETMETLGGQTRVLQEGFLELKRGLKRIEDATDEVARGVRTSSEQGAAT